MTSQGYYRGGSRSRFSTQVSTGSMTFTGALTVVPVSLAASGSQLRLKRIQVSLMLPKQGSATLDYHGWGAFLRIPDDYTAAYADLDTSDPSVLRAKPVMANPDHATYWDFYLDAINLDGGEFLGFLLRLNRAPPQESLFSLRFTEERALG